MTLSEFKSAILCELIVRSRLLGLSVDLDVVFTSRGGDFVAPDGASEHALVEGSPKAEEGVAIVEGEDSSDELL